MIRVFFDDTEIDGNYIMKLTQTVNPYVQGFTLGSTICRQFSVDIHRDANVTTPEKVYLYEDNDSETQSDWDLYATLFVDSVETAEDNHTSFNLTDIMVRFNTLLTYQGTVLDVLNQICTDKGITLNTQDLYLKDIEIGEVSINERDLISYVAEVNGGYAYIDNEGNLNIVRYENKAYSNIDSDMCSTLRIGAYHRIGRVSYYASGSTEEYYPSSTEYDTVSLNPDNILLHDDSTRWIIMQHIYSLVRGFAFYNVKIEKCPIDPNIRAGQLINVGGWRNLISSGEEYITTLAGERILVSDGLLIPFLCEIDWIYNTKWLGGYTTDLENKTQEATPYITNQDKVRSQLEMKVSKDDNDQIISMINASADNIILNTKSLIFGIYPDGQYIEVKNYYSNNTPIGVIFEGTGQVRFSSQGRFQAENYINGRPANSLFMYVTDYTYTVALSNSIVNANTNFAANSISMNSAVSTGGTLMNSLQIGNTDAVSGATNFNVANRIILASSSSGTNNISIINSDNDGELSNQILMSHSSTNALTYLYNYHYITSKMANSITLTSHSTGQSIFLSNYTQDGDLVNSINITSNSDGSNNSISIQNYKKTGDNTFTSVNWISLGSSGVIINGHILSFSNGYVMYS